MTSKKYDSMIHLKKFNDFINESTLTSFSPMTRHIASQGISAIEQTDRLPKESECDECDHYRRKGHNYCSKCSKCLLSRDETKAKMVLAKSDRDKYRLQKCMKKHGLKFE